jgi:hypothetical protein
VFDMAMAAGSGTITITDGAVQTVIDRATGQPTMRVVGATDTHTVSAASASVDGVHVKLNVASLLPGHQYSIVMGSGVLLSSDHVAFGGVRSTSQLQFTAPAIQDREGPSFVSAAADAALLKAGGSLKVTLTFSEIVSGLSADALNAPNATVSSLAASGDGHTWVATLLPSGAFEQASNALTIDMSKVHDAVGNAGTGVSTVASYAVDTLAPTGVAMAFDGTVLKAGAGIGVTFTFSEAVTNFAASAITAPHATIGNLASSDGGHTWTATLSALDPDTSSGNKLSIDMSKLQDLNGNAGSGSFVSSASYAIDTVGPDAPVIQLHGGLVSKNDSVDVVLTFKEKVSLDAGAVIAPNASVQEPHTTDGGLTWVATLRPGTPAEASANTLAIDMSKVHDAAGNAGSGSALAADAYAVDSTGPTATITLDGTDLRYGSEIEATITLSDRIGAEDTYAALRAALSPQNATIDGLYQTEDGQGLVWRVILKSDGHEVAPNNVLSLDLGKLSDTHGNAGAGSVQSPAYAADNAVSAYVASGIGIHDYGSSDGDYLTNAADQTFSFTLSGPPAYGSHIELSIDGHGVSGDSLKSEGNNYYSYQDSGTTHFADGLHSFSARVVDGAGHGSAAVTQEFTIDTVKPTLADWPEGAITLGAPNALELKFSEAVYMPFPTSTSILFNDDASGASVEVALNPGFLSEDGKTLTIRADQHHLQAGKNYHFTLPEGLYDLAGNGATATPLSIHVVSDDLQAPSATSAIAQKSAGIYGIGQTIEIAVAFDEAVKVAGSGQPALNLNNGGVAVFHALSADKQTMYFTYTVGAGNEADTGNLQLKDKADLAGHVSDLAGNMLDLAHIDFSLLGNGNEIQIDAHASPAPGTPVLSAAGDTGTPGDSLTMLHMPSLSGSGADGAVTVKLYEDATLLASTTSDAGGAWTMATDAWSYGKQLSDGAHTLVVRQYDSANNESAASGTLTISVDTAAPNKPGAPVLALASDTGASDHDGLTSDATPTLSGVAAEAGGKIELYLNDGATALATADVGVGGAWSLTVPDALALAEGVASLSVRQVDAAGNRGASSDALALTVDKTAPAVLAKAVLDAASDSGILSNDGITNIKTPKLTGTALAAGTVEIYDGATLIGTTEVQGDKTWSFTVGSQPTRLAQFDDRTHNLTVRQVDTAGNRSAASEVLSVTVDTVAPTFKSSELEWNSDKHRFELKFSEQIVFAANATIDVLDNLNLLYSHHAGDVKTNWEIGIGDSGLPSVLELNLGTLLGLFGHFYLKADTSAIQDVAGNVAVIGTPNFDVPGLPH